MKKNKKVTYKKAICPTCNNKINPTIKGDYVQYLCKICKDT